MYFESTSVRLLRPEPDARLPRDRRWFGMVGKDCMKLARLLDAAKDIDDVLCNLVVLVIVVVVVVVVREPIDHLP